MNILGPTFLVFLVLALSLGSIILLNKRTSLSYKEEDKPKTEVCREYKNEYFDVGKTYVHVEFINGDVITLCYEGEFSQYDSITTVNNPTITTSIEVAQNYLSSIKHTCDQYGLSGYNTPHSRFYGPIYKATIGHTESFKKEFQVYYRVEKETQ